MPLTEEAFTALVDAGCPGCKSTKLVVDTYVAQRLPLLGGELYGATSWGYKGEELVRGTYRITCGSCENELFASTDCPRCAAPDGLTRALEGENGFPLPTSCTACGSEQITAAAFVPAVVVSEGKRPSKARTQTAPEDPGFHAYRVECKQCRNVAEQRSPCPLCSGAQ